MAVPDKATLQDALAAQRSCSSKKSLLTPPSTSLSLMRANAQLGNSSLMDLRPFSNIASSAAANLFLLLAYSCRLAFATLALFQCLELVGRLPAIAPNDAICAPLLAARPCKLKLAGVSRLLVMYDLAIEAPDCIPL